MLTIYTSPQNRVFYLSFGNIASQVIKKKVQQPVYLHNRFIFHSVHVCYMMSEICKYLSSSAFNVTVIQNCQVKCIYEFLFTIIFVFNNSINECFVNGHNFHFAVLISLLPKKKVRLLWPTTSVFQRCRNHSLRMCRVLLSSSKCCGCRDSAALVVQRRAFRRRSSILHTNRW